jgi:Protein of unknown function (DUF3098)
MKQNITKDTQEVPSTAKQDTSGLAFGKSNFTIMLAGIAIIFVGFIIMTLDKEEFGFGFMGITLGPIIVFIGLMIEFYAILKKKV